MTIFLPLDHLKVEHEYTADTWQDFTGDLVLAQVNLREMTGKHTATLSFYRAAMDPSQSSATTVIKKGDRVRVFAHNAALTLRKAATFKVEKVDVAIDLKAPAGRQHKVTVTLGGSGFIALAGTTGTTGVTSLPELSNIITGAPFEINGDGFGSGITAPTGVFTEVADIATASELDQLILTRDTNPGTVAFEDPDGRIQVFDSSAYRTGAAAHTITADNYSSIDVGFDMSHIINIVKVKYVQKVKAGAPHTRVVAPFSETYQDAASVAKYGPFKRVVTVHHLSDFAALANDILARNADPAQVPRSVTIPINSAADLLPGYQDGHYVGSKVNVVLPDGVTTYECRIGKIAHAITPQKWLVQVFLRHPDLIQRPRHTALVTDVANNPDGTVQTDHLDDSAVTTAKIATDAVTGVELAPTAVDGKTITGAVFQTSDAGLRTVISDIPPDGFSPGGPAIEFYTGIATEVSGRLQQTTETIDTFSGPVVNLRSGTTDDLPNISQIRLKPRQASEPIGQIDIDGNVFIYNDLEVDGTLSLNGTDIMSMIAGIPPGTILFDAGPTPPSGYLPCNGASVLRADYPALFNRIGTTWGAVDSTHFTLPDYRVRIPIGVGTGTPLASNEAVAEASRAAAHNHAHTHGPGTLATDTFSHTQWSDTTTGGTAKRLTAPPDHSHGLTGATASGGGPRHPFLAINFIIKT